MGLGDYYRKGLGVSATKRKASPRAPAVRARDWDGWIWPVPNLPNGVRPHVSDGYGSSRDGGGRRHAGVDIMFPKQRHQSERVNPPTESKGNYFPDGWWAVAPQDGVVVWAAPSRKGYNMIIDHGMVGREHVRTYYQHLLLGDAAMQWRKGERVSRGQILGIVSHDPTDHEGLNHLHFEIRFPKASRNPAPYLKHWKKTDLGSHR